MSQNQSQSMPVEMKIQVNTLPWTAPPRPEILTIRDTIPEVHRDALRFGVEFEFFFMGDARIFLREFERDWCVFERHVRRQFMRWMRNSGIMIADQMDFASLPAGAMATHFHIKEEASIDAMCEQRETEAAVGMEISSPPLPFNEESFALITKVTNRIRELGGQVNDTCGLHVHVGTLNQLVPGFSLKTAKLVAHLTTIAYEQLNQLHGESRVLNKFATSPHTQFESEDVYEIANAIEDIKTIEELVRVFQVPVSQRHLPEEGQKRHKYTTVNYINLVEGFNTIEFRAHAGTLDPFCVLRWIKTVAMIVETSCTRSNPYIEITRKIKAARDGSGEEYHIYDLLEDLNADELLEEWRDDVWWHEYIERDEFPDLDLAY